MQQGLEPREGPGREQWVQLENLIDHSESLELVHRARQSVVRLSLAPSQASLREPAASSRLLLSPGCVSLGWLLPFRHLLFSLVFFYKWPSRFGTLAKLPDRSRPL